MKWEILILSQPCRHAMLRQLLGCFESQLAGLPDVAVRVRNFNEKISLGENREAMRQASTAEYINFFDDDDLPAQNYVSKIYPLLDGVDQIGFKVQFYVDFCPRPMTYHSLIWKGWYEDRKGYYRDISHLNPMRRELALKVAMEGGVGEDSRWSSRLRALGVVKTEHYVDEVLYHYLYRLRKNDQIDAFDPRRFALAGVSRTGFVPQNRA